MSTQLQLFVHDCPDAQAEALIDALDEFELHVDWEGPYVSAGRLNIGTPYTDRSAYGDKSKDVAAAIIDAAPGAMFTVWTDPTDEWLGALVRYTPTLGRYDSDCDIEGQAVFREHEIAAWAISGKPISDLIGTRWSVALTGSTVERVITYTPTGN